MSSNCRAMKKQTHIPKADESSSEIRAQRGVSSRSRKLREIAASISGCRWTSSGHRSDIALSEELAGAHSRVGTRGDRCQHPSLLVAPQISHKRDRGRLTIVNYHVALARGSPRDRLAVTARVRGFIMPAFR